MITLTIRTDKPEAEIGLYDTSNQLGYQSWQAHRQLAETLHTKIQDLLVQSKKEFSDIQGVIVYAGPGSFTGLRIGISVANALAYALDIPIVGSMTEKWIELGHGLLIIAREQPITLVAPVYGAPVHITVQRK